MCCVRGSTLVATCLLTLMAACTPDGGSGPTSPGRGGGASPADDAGPLIGASHVLLPDPAGDGTLLVSGPPEGTTGGDLLLARWDGAAWHDVDISGEAPEARNFFAAVLDPEHDVVVVHGGETADGVSDETWLWDGATWRRAAGDGPGARMAASLVWEPASGAALLHGGHDETGAIQDDTWAFDGDGWTRLATRGPVPGRWPAAVVATGDGPVVAYGGHQVADDELPPALADTWVWHHAVWEAAPRAGGPGRLVNAQGLLHPDLGPLLLGGSDLETETGDVWRWSGHRWERFGRDVLPARQAFGAAYDAEREVVVLTGGVVVPGQTVRHQDVWEWGGDPDEPAELVADRPPA